MELDLKNSIRRHFPADVNLPDGEIRVLESHHAADFEMELDAWPFHKVCWVAIGRGILEFQKGMTSIEPNDFIILPAGWEHRFIDSQTEPLTLVIFCISEQYFVAEENQQMFQLWKRLLNSFGVGRPFCGKSAFHHNSLVDIFRQALQEQDHRKIGWESALAALNYWLLIRFNRGYCEPKETYEESSLQTIFGAVEYITNHMTDPLQIESMSRRCNLSPRRFTDLFKQATGETFSKYLNRKRIEYACERLKETGHILYACHASGFNDLAYFYRVFKKHTGLTPGDYLRNKFQTTA